MIDPVPNLLGCISASKRLYQVFTSGDTQKRTTSHHLCSRMTRIFSSVLLICVKTVQSVLQPPCLNIAVILTLD